LVPVMRQPTSKPRSAVVSTYVFSCAPAITAPLRSHSYVVESGEFANPPSTHVSVEPTVGVPVSVGGAIGTGARICVESGGGATTRMCRSFVDVFPALSTASAVSVTVEPTADAGGKYRNWNGYTGTLAYGRPLAYRLT